jgi:hypothetical protein
MAYRVVWHPRARNDLAQLWLAGRDRYRINDAAERLDEELEREPRSLGESRDGDERIVFIEPIACQFRVDPLNNVVYVEAIWRSR